MNIDGLTNGTVIDHITAGRGMRIYELLNLLKTEVRLDLRGIELMN